MHERGGNTNLQGGPTVNSNVDASGNTGGEFREPMQLVLVTGAGASREVGSVGQPLPLMSDWERAVIEVLGSQLAASIGLREGQSPEEFEEIVGSFLSWTRNLHMTERFITTGIHPVGTGDNHVNEWLNRARGTGDRCRVALLETLYRLFGANSVDRDRAASAWRLVPKVALLSMWPMGIAVGRCSVGALSDVENPAHLVVQRTARVEHSTEYHQRAPGREFLRLCFRKGVA